jgi:DNA polymerase III subunit gamma/tau
MPMPAPTATASAVPTGVVDVEAVRRVWPDVVARLAGLRRVTWMLVRDHATVASFDGRRLVLSLRPGPLASFRSGAHAENVQHALIDVLGVEALVEATSFDGLDEPTPGEAPGHGTAAQEHPGASARADAAASWASPPTEHEDVEAQPAPDEPAPPRRPEPEAAREPAADHSHPATGHAAAEPTMPTMPRMPLVDAAHDEASRDDVDAADSGLVGRPVVEQLLGGRVVDETDA